jgi:hypothetical protein
MRETGQSFTDHCKFSVKLTGKERTSRGYEKNVYAFKIEPGQAPAVTADDF